MILCGGSTVWDLRELFEVPLHFSNVGGFFDCWVPFTVSRGKVPGFLFRDFLLRPARVTPLDLEGWGLLTAPGTLWPKRRVRTPQISLYFLFL